MRQSKDDYYRTALELLAEGGVDALTMANLCARLGVTTGSFYAHFGGIREFHSAFLEQWAEGRVYQLKEQVDAMPDPLDRIDLLRCIAVAVNHEAESAIRGWSRTNPVVAEFQRRVDRVREEVLLQAFVDIGIDKKEARASGSRSSSAPSRSRTRSIASDSTRFSRSTNAGWSRGPLRCHEASGS
jgi:AcrR family transcriptional regulator